MSQRITNPETITAMVPLLSRIAADLDRAYFRVAMLYAMDTEPGVDALSDALDRVQELVIEIERLGGSVRSYSPIGVDFMAEVDGEIGYVRWEQGSNEAGRFHGADALYLSATTA